MLHRFITFCLLSLLISCTGENTKNVISVQRSDHQIVFEQECTDKLNKAKSLYLQLESNDGAKTIESVLVPLNQFDRLIDGGFSIASLYANVHPDEAVRDSAEKCEQQFSDIYTQFSLSRPIYDAIKGVDISKADDDTKRYHEKVILEFKRSGVDKSDSERERIKVLRDEIVKLGQEFSKNIRDDVRHIYLDSARELAGLPQDYIDRHKPNDDNKIEISTDYPDYFPFMTYASNDDARLELYKVFRNRGYPNNEDVLKQLLNKRYELARILGYENYAEFITETKMIKNVSNVRSFIQNINEIAASKSDLDYQELLNKLKEIEPEAKEVGDWQKTYITELVKQEKYQFDSKELRPYFSYKKVRDGIFDLINTLFNIEIKPWITEPWHESVEAYEMWDNGKVIGQFYLDMHPRDGKYKHAAQFSIQSGIKNVQLPIAALICNFPGGDEDQGLMDHDQVETFLHEFGHLIHHIFAGQQQWINFSGVATEWDFVEAPSQMLEEWVWDKESLKFFAVNSNGETLSDELVKKMNKARNFGRGLRIKQQMYYSAISLNYYNRSPDSFDLTDLMVDLQKQYTPFAYVNDTHFYASFGHLDGYSAIYYTYMWSLVIASDMFSEFKKQGILNSDVASRYRSMVLEPGGSKDASELITDFLGRSYNYDAFEKELSQSPN